MVDIKRLEELQEICHRCKQPTRYPGCESHCEVGRERVELNAQKRNEEYARRRIDFEKRAYIHESLGKKRRKK